MAENLIVNGTVYNGVDSISMQNENGEKVPFYPDAVRYNAQALTDEQKEQARQNIGALAESELPTAVNTALSQAKESGEFDGPQGKTAYEYAKDGGYTGTEEEFQAMLATQHLPLAGGTMQGAMAMGGNLISGLATPKSDTDAVTKAYVDKKYRRGNVTLRSANWTANAPYTQTVSLTGANQLDWAYARPSYSGTLSSDLELKNAWNCVDYVYTLNNAVAVVCLENKPTTDMRLAIELFRL